MPIATIDLTGGWRPGIGDPTIMGWLTVGAYLVTAWLCWRVAGMEARVRSGGFDGPRPWFWYLLAAALVVLGINKQLDLQSWFTAVGRALAQQVGWMDRRRMVQMTFIALVCLLGLGFALAGLVYLRNQWRRYWMPWVGMVAIICFVVIRAASFHHVDRFLNLGWPLFSVDDVLELSGIALVAVGALRVIHELHHREPISAGAHPD